MISFATLHLREYPRFRSVSGAFPASFCAIRGVRGGRGRGVRIRRIHGSRNLHTARHNNTLFQWLVGCLLGQAVVACIHAWSLRPTVSSKLLL